MRIAIVAAALVAAGCTAHAASVGLAPARFSAGHGWHVGASGVKACPGVPRSRCTYTSSWASAGPWRDCPDCAGAERTLAHMDRNGIAIFLSLSKERFRQPRAIRWPPRLRLRAIVSPVEGHASRFSLFSLGGRLHGLDAGLYVWFGRPHPTRGQIARAQAELDSAKIP